MQKALKGAASKGAHTKLIHLYDLNFKGCISCFECKRTGGKSVRHRAVDDDLKTVLVKIDQTGALIIGSSFTLAKLPPRVRARRLT